MLPASGRIALSYTVITSFTFLLDAFLQVDQARELLEGKVFLNNRHVRVIAVRDG